SLFTGAALVAGYGLLGATWLVMKTEGGLQALCRRIAGFATIAVLGAIAIVSIWTPLIHEGVRARWLTWPKSPLRSRVPVPRALAAPARLLGLRRGAQFSPCLLSLARLALSSLGLATSLYPYIVPPSVTFRQAAAPDASLGFLLVGAAVLLAIILAYTAYSYWVFRGKTRADAGYH